MPRYTVYQLPGARSGSQLVKNEETGQHFITLCLYAELIGAQITIDIEANAARRVENGKVIY